MRMTRPALLALAAAAAVSAAPANAAIGDGPENAGIGCQAVLTQTSTGTWSGVMIGGAWVAADVIENYNGIIGIASEPGVVPGFGMRCWIHEVYGGDDHAKTEAAVVGPVAVIGAVPVSFDTNYNTFEVCTEIRWDVPGDPTHRETNCTELL